MKNQSLACEDYERNLNEWSDMQGHLPTLKSAAKGNVMEIGIGRSTSALLAGIEENGGHLWSVDIKQYPLIGNAADRTVINADSVKDAEQIKTMLPESLDVLFIDGDHSFEAVSADLRNYGDRAKLILLHDAEAPDYPGVARAISDYCYWNHLNYTILHGSYGLGVIIR